MKTTEKYIDDVKHIHGNKYDYSKVEYKGDKYKICIICPEHGEFWQIPSSHLRGYGCAKCSKTYIRTKEDFINDAIKIHGVKYDYSNIEYIDMKTKICIICNEKDEFGNEHGEFWQTPKMHLKSYGCKKCSNNYMDIKSFILKSKNIHNNKYDYSKVEYKNNKTKVCIICNKHGEFWQTPNSHLNGRGCPLCKESHLEKKVRLKLTENSIEYIYQYHNKEIFNRQSLDFYVHDKKIGIECQGFQHFKTGGRYQDLESIRIRDKQKKKLCKENGIHLIYYVPKNFIEYIEKDDIYFSDINELIDYIKNYKNLG